MLPAIPSGSTPQSPSLCSELWDKMSSQGLKRGHLARGKWWGKDEFRFKEKEEMSSTTVATMEGHCNSSTITFGSGSSSSKSITRFCLVCESSATRSSCSWNHVGSRRAAPQTYNKNQSSVSVSTLVGNNVEAAFWKHNDAVTTKERPCDHGGEAPSGCRECLFLASLRSLGFSHHFRAGRVRSRGENLHHFPHRQIGWSAPGEAL